MREHLDKLFELFDTLGELDVALNETVSVSVMISSLSPEYEALVTAIEAWDESRLTIQIINAKLMEEWEKKENGEYDEARVELP